MVKFVWCAQVHLPCYMNETVEFPLTSMNWFSVCDVNYGQVFTVGISVSLRLGRWSVFRRRKLFAVVNGRWTTSNQKLLVLEPKVVVFEPRWIKSTERAKRLLIPPVYSLRGIRSYDELHIVVTEVGQVKQTVKLVCCLKFVTALLLWRQVSFAYHWPHCYWTIKNLQVCIRPKEYTERNANY